MITQSSNSFQDMDSMIKTKLSPQSPCQRSSTKRYCGDQGWWGLLFNCRCSKISGRRFLEYPIKIFYRLYIIFLKEQRFLWTTINLFYIVMVQVSSDRVRGYLAVTLLGINGYQYGQVGGSPKQYRLVPYTELSVSTCDKDERRGPCPPLWHTTIYTPIFRVYLNRKITGDIFSGFQCSAVRSTGFETNHSQFLGGIVYIISPYWSATIKLCPFSAQMPLFWAEM